MTEIKKEKLRKKIKGKKPGMKAKDESSIQVTNKSRTKTRKNDE